MSAGNTAPRTNKYKCNKTNKLSYWHKMCISAIDDNGALVMKSYAKMSIVAVALATVATAGVAIAGTVPYPNAGTVNPVTYTFTAASTGVINAYFAGSGASYDEQVGLLVNGVKTGEGLDDHSSTVGQMINLGSVKAGDKLVYFDQVFTTGSIFYSVSAKNSDLGNHIYSTSVVANQVYVGSPAGTYVGFEDLAFPGSDYNYFDDSFIFTNTSTVATGAVPEPTMWALMLVGFGAIGCAMRRRARVNVSYA